MHRDNPPLSQPVWPFPTATEFPAWCTRITAAAACLHDCGRTPAWLSASMGCARACSRALPGRAASGCRVWSWTQPGERRRSPPLVQSRASGAAYAAAAAGRPRTPGTSSSQKQVPLLPCLKLLQSTRDSDVAIGTAVQSVAPAARRNGICSCHSAGVILHWTANPSFSRRVCLGKALVERAPSDTLRIEIGTCYAWAAHCAGPGRVCTAAVRAADDANSGSRLIGDSNGVEVWPLCRLSTCNTSIAALSMFYSIVLVALRIQYDRTY